MNSTPQFLASVIATTVITDLAICIQRQTSALPMDLIVSFNGYSNAHVL